MIKRSKIRQKESTARMRRRSSALSTMTLLVHLVRNYMMVMLIHLYDAFSICIHLEIRYPRIQAPLTAAISLLAISPNT